MAQYTRVPDANPAGGWKVSDEQAIKEQRGVVWDLIKQLGQSLTQGEMSLTKVATPVHIAEPRSYLERICDGWCYAPIYLKQAAMSDDPVERLKNVITFAVAGFSNTCTAKKPFNPIIGETYEATLEDGSEVFCEQISHHPPVTAWEVFGPGNCYHFYGEGEWCASFRGNSIKGEQLGTHHIAFPDGTVIDYELPAVWARGIMWGDRIVEYDGTMVFKDRKNKLIAEVKFNPDSGGWFSAWRKKAPSDYIDGAVYKFNKSEDDRKEICKVAGTWLGCVEFGDKHSAQKYWDWEQNLQKFLPIPVEHPLPSDVRFRKDIEYLKAGNIEQAGAWKSKLEEIQRRDARLRKASGSSSSH